MDDGSTASDSVVAGPTPRRISEMKYNLSRIADLIDGIQRLSTARRKTNDEDFVELRERIAALPLPTE